jgi:hypothetical protein
MTNGISGPGKHLGMPVGPRLLFIAANDLAEAEQVAQQDHDELVRAANDSVVRGARRFVWVSTTPNCGSSSDGWEVCSPALHWIFDRVGADRARS